VVRDSAAPQRSPGSWVPLRGGEVGGGSYPQVGAERGYMNFLERRSGEVLRIILLRGWVDKGIDKGRGIK
jgi:hypothetical protein